MPRLVVVAIALAAALTGTTSGTAVATPRVTAVTSRPAKTPTQVTVTRPRGFAWREALLGAAATGLFIALVAAAAGPRRGTRPAPPNHPPPNEAP